MRKRKPLYGPLRLRILSKRHKMIPDHIQKVIKDRAEIAEVVGHFLSLRKTGSRLKTLCPFHDEKTPSFHVTPSKGIFKCFGCGKGGDGIHFLMEHERMSYPDALTWLANFYHIPVDGGNGLSLNQASRRAEPLPKLPKLPPSFMDDLTFQRSLSGYDSNNLVQWLCQRLGRGVVMEAVQAYHIGTAKNGGTIFWQVNIEGRASTGHVILYPPDDHRRIKAVAPTWVHYILRMTDPEKYHWTKYWFGEHLLAKYPTRPIAIVESEKTALVASIYLAHLGFVWLSSCGNDGLNNRDKWKVLKGREVVLYPDLSPPENKGQTPFQYWTAIASEMETCGLDVSVNDFLESQADEFERSQKWDLADFLLRRDLTEFQSHSVPMLPAPLAELPPGYCLENYTAQSSGQDFEVLLNANGYPAEWGE